MKSLKLTIIALLLTFSGFSQINMPQSSPAGSVSSTVGLTKVSVDYFRPKMKGRKIFGTGDEFLEQYGTMWRTGANSGSILKLDGKVTIGDVRLASGEYQILTIPNKDEWTVVFYDGNIGGNMNAFKEENAAISIKVKPTKLSSNTETLTFNISDLNEENTAASLELQWADVSIKVPMTVSFDEEVMAQISANTQVDPQSYVQAANYYLNTGKDLNQALAWMNKYLAVGENGEQFWNVYTKARILAALGEKKEAIATAKASMAMAKVNDGGDFGYTKRNKELISSLQ